MVHFIWPVMKVKTFSLMVVIMIYLFAHNDSLTSKRFTTRTEQLTKFCEPLHKMRVRDRAL